MKFSLRSVPLFNMVLISLLTSVLLATAAFADSFSANLARIHRKSQPFQNAQDNSLPSDDAPKVLYSNNWSGSAWNKSETVREGNE